MSDDRQPRDLTQGSPAPRSRRAFFATVGLGAAAAGVAAAGMAVRPAEAAEGGSAVPDSAGYRETEHVRKVYALARF